MKKVEITAYGVPEAKRMPEGVPAALARVREDRRSGKVAVLPNGPL